MCGLFVSTESEFWSTLLQELVSSLAHRGPDQQSVADLKDGPLMVQTRLEIIGLGDVGRQPVQTEDSNLFVVFNGEILNYRELARKYGFGSPINQSDARVLAEILASQPLASLSGLRGMFAFVSWDPTTRTMSAMRDPFGIKPLYCLRHANGGISLSSTLPALLLSPEARVVDRLGLAQFLALGYTGPTQTLYSRIDKLHPGRLYRWQEFDRAWRMSVSAVPARDIQPSGVGAALANSVDAHLVADVEVGTFLSGGLDSTLLTALASRRHPDVHAFTLSFPEAPTSDEANYARSNAATMGVRHHVVPVTSREMATSAGSFIREHGEPFADAAALPLSLLSQAAAEHVKVVLAGEGADELFGGYSRYKVSRRLSPTSRLLSSATHSAAAQLGRRRGQQGWTRAAEAVLWGGGARSHAALLNGELGLLATLDGRLHDDVLDRFIADWPGARGDHNDLAAAQLFDRTRWLPNVYLEKTDRATMSASLEARVPYLDQEVAAAAARSSYPNQTKTPLREALSDILPDARMPARKKGLAVDTRSVCGGHLRHYIHHEIHDRRSLLQRYFGSEGCQHIARRLERSPALEFRVAMIGVWEDQFDGETFACT